MGKFTYHGNLSIAQMMVATNDGIDGFVKEQLASILELLPKDTVVISIEKLEREALSLAMPILITLESAEIEEGSSIDAEYERRVEKIEGQGIRQWNELVCLHVHSFKGSISLYPKLKNSS
jgi:hypothetical protein